MSTLYQHPDIRADPADAARVLEQSDERDKWQQRVLDEARRAYRAGVAVGYAARRRELDEAWRDTPPVDLTDGSTLAELEARRWTVRGEQRTRETFSLPHEADYRGREEAA